jgi:hypothetical protein
LDIEEGYKSSLNFLSLAQKYKRQFSSSWTPLVSSLVVLSAMLHVVHVFD